VGQLNIAREKGYLYFCFNYKIEDRKIQIYRSRLGK
jgi:hypothetical protein